MLTVHGFEKYAIKLLNRKNVQTPYYKSDVCAQCGTTYPILHIMYSDDDGTYDHSCIQMIMLAMTIHVFR